MGAVFRQPHEKYEEIRAGKCGNSSFPVCAVSAVYACSLFPYAYIRLFDSCSTGYIPFPRRAYSVYVSRKDYYDISLCAEGRKRKQCVCANVHAWCAGCICPAVPAGEGGYSEKR